MSREPRESMRGAPLDRRIAARDRFAHNPFFVLGLAPDCSRADVEREGQKLIAMLELGLSAARSFTSPLGRHERTSELVREAMAELRVPDRSLNHELWASLPVSDVAAEAASSDASSDSTSDSTSEPSSEGGEARLDALAPFAGLALLGLSPRRSPR